MKGKSTRSPESLKAVLEATSLDKSELRASDSSSKGVNEFEDISEGETFKCPGCFVDRSGSKSTGAIAQVRILRPEKVGVSARPETLEEQVPKEWTRLTSLGMNL